MDCEISPALSALSKGKAKASLKTVGGQTKPVIFLEWPCEVAFNTADSYAKNKLRGVGSCTVFPVEVEEEEDKRVELWPLVGARGKTVLASTSVDQETLSWLREDLQNFSLDDFKMFYRKEGKDNIELLFAVEQTEPKLTTFNGDRCAGVLPLKHVQAWLRAWKNVNQQQLKLLQFNLRKQISKKQEKSANAQIFLESDVMTWASSVVTLQFRRGSLPEPKHFDGGGSLLHLSMTLSGKRRATRLCQALSNRTIQESKPPWRFTNMWSQFHIVLRHVAPIVLGGRGDTLKTPFFLLALRAGKVAIHQIEDKPDQMLELQPGSVYYCDFTRDF